VIRTGAKARHRGAWQGGSRSVSNENAKHTSQNERGLRMDRRPLL
jgi:hypothetical protein